MILTRSVTGLCFRRDDLGVSRCRKAGEVTRHANNAGWCAFLRKIGILQGLFGIFAKKIAVIPFFCYQSFLLRESFLSFRILLCIRRNLFCVFRQRKKATKIGPRLRCGEFPTPQNYPTCEQLPNWETTVAPQCFHVVAGWIQCSVPKGEQHVWPRRTLCFGRVESGHFNERWTASKLMSLGVDGGFPFKWRMPRNWMLPPKKL